jgi:hypothetical protein
VGDEEPRHLEVDRQALGVVAGVDTGAAELRVLGELLGGAED